jgi:ribose transport system permease protein
MEKMAEIQNSAKEREEEISEQERLTKVAKRKEQISSVTPFLGLALIVIFFTIVTKGVLISTNNLNNLVAQCFNLVIIAVGASFIFAHGGMDMAIGSIVGVSSLVGALCLTNPTIPIWAAFLAAILVGMFCEFLTSIINVSANVPVFVVSLCMKYICTGVITTAVSKSDVFIDYNKFQYLNNGMLKAFVLVCIIAIGYFIFEYTSLGKDLKAIGGNQVMAYQSGVKTKKNIVYAFLITGALIGIVAMFSLARVGSVGAQTGAGLEFDAMTAIVLGNFPMLGGSASKIRSAIVGAIIVSVLTNGLTLWGVDPSLIYGIKGILFLTIVYVSYDRRKGDIVA